MTFCRFRGKIGRGIFKAMQGNFVHYCVLFTGQFGGLVEPCDNLHHLCGKSTQPERTEKDIKSPVQS